MNSIKNKPRVALVYDRINKWGGAERILLLLHELFPDAPIFTSVYEPRNAPWAKDLDVKTSFLEKIPFARAHHEFFPLLMPIAFESFDFDKFDVVITLTSESAKGILTKPSTRHVCICLTPTRYLWSEYKTYFPNRLARFFAAPFTFYLKAWDKVAVSRPDVILSISETVQGRVKKYYKKNSEILYPPLFLSGKNKRVKQGRYFLVVSRLSRFSPHKKVELAIEACNKLKLPLKVVGDGDLEYFRNLAGDTVEIVGKVDDKKLATYYENCTALIFPGIEDFGLVMVEAQSFGKPVIAYRGGGATEIVINGVTGEFFDNQSVSALVNTLKTFDKKGYNSKKCVENAKRFDKRVFMESLMTIINRREDIQYR